MFIFFTLADTKKIIILKNSEKNKINTKKLKLIKKKLNKTINKELISDLYLKTEIIFKA